MHEIFVHLFLLSHTVTSRELVRQFHLLGKPKTLLLISKEAILCDKSHSDIYDKSKVILKPYGFSSILFALKLPKAITLVVRQI